jgi:6-phosphogluconolactonase
MSFELINSAREVWLTIAGVDKADAVSVAFSENKKSLPVGKIGGLSKTVWFIDQAAASAI